MSVQEAYRSYRSESFKVNRLYQRKLVWTQNEKEKLIDSILQGYPVPLFLLAQLDGDKKSKLYEILDGLQRLNSIFSFIENRFSIDGKYFDVEQLSRANNLAEKGVFTPVKDKTKLLSPEKCANVLDYQLAVTIFPSDEDRDINEIFSRINSYGRNLSSQDKRQAGVISSFANLVRRLAADIRGDSSPERLDLSEMSEISIDISGDQQSYGITAKDTFWCREGIIRKRDLRDSHDEQFLADVVVSILSDEPFPYRRENMDEVYEKGTDRHNSVEENISVYGEEDLERDIWSTYQEIKKVFDERDSIRDVVNPGSSNPVKTDFYAIFMAFYELIIKDDKLPSEIDKIVEGLENVHDSLKVARGAKSIKSRIKNINTVKGRIQDHFVKAKNPVDGSGVRLRRNIERILQRSRIESSLYECKQGIIGLGNDRNLNKGLLKRIPNTICAIANVDPDSEGAFILGVADSSSDAERIEDMDDIDTVEVANRFVVGIDREADRLDISLEDYERLIIKAIRDSQLSDPLKSDVLRNIQTFVYKGIHITYIRVPNQVSISKVGNDVFVREGSSTVKRDDLDKIFELKDRFEEHRS